MRIKAVFRKKPAGIRLGSLRESCSHLHPERNGSMVFPVCLLPTNHPADTGKLLWLGITELN